VRLANFVMLKLSHRTERIFFQAKCHECKNPTYYTSERQSTFNIHSGGIHEKNCKDNRIFAGGHGDISELRTGHPRGGAETPDNFVLNVGYFEFPGVTYTDDKGKAAGLVNEITIKTLDNTKMKYLIQSYSAPMLFDKFSKGEIHLFNGVSTLPPIQASAISSQIPLFEVEMRAYWVGNKPPIKEKEDLLGHSVILLKGFTYKDWGAWIRDQKNKVVFYEPYTHESAYEMLKKGRAEYLLSYKYIDDEILSKVKIPDLVVKPLFQWHCVFNISKNTPNAAALLKKLEDSYQQLVLEGKLKKHE